MTTTPVNTIDAKEQFSDLINRVSHNQERIILTRRGKEVAAIVPLNDLHALEAQENQSDLEEAVLALKEAREQGVISIEILKGKIGSLS